MSILHSFHSYLITNQKSIDMKNNNFLKLAAVLLFGLLTNHMDAKPIFKLSRSFKTTNNQSSAKAFEVYGLNAIIVDRLDVCACNISRSANFVDDLGADEIEMLELRAAVKYFYTIEITDEEWETVTTVGDLEDLITEKI
jgi:acyl carrier protein